MTSGNFSNFPVDRITVDRDARQRRELENIDELAGSIERDGLINPIIIEKSGVLVVGERRLEAVKKLGWEKIQVQFAEDLPPEKLRRIELQENICRDELLWRDECHAIREYHQLMKDQNKGWSQADTAKSLGKTQPEISDKINVAEAQDAGDKTASTP